MSRLIFDADDVRRIVEHTLAAEQHREHVTGYDADFKAITEPGKPAVILVHDQGVYLMSNGLPADARDPANPDGGCFVAYAKGCHPDKDVDWYETARRLVGGDDFGETLPFAQGLKGILERGAKQIAINLGKRSVSLGKAKF